MMKKQILPFLLVLLLLAAVLPAQESTCPTALLGALDDEVAWLRDQLQDRRDTTFSARTFSLGRLHGRPVVIAVTGVGKVNAAMTATLLADHFKPEAVIFSGVAGGLNPALQPGDIVIASRTVQHDLGEITADSLINWGVRIPGTKERMPTFLPADSALLKLALESAAETSWERVPTTVGLRQPKVIVGLIATGDVFISSSLKKQELRRRLSPEAVEMEGAAVAQVCCQLGLPCLVIRALSDRADEHAMQDFEKFFQAAARNANRLVMGMMAGRRR